ncbi:MAG: hypothetical protein OEZ36_06070, partial [Spirochaetota bacterium]|nr:hypothetical protein [Spirochaetota bacterium]
MLHKCAYNGQTATKNFTLTVTGNPTLSADEAALQITYGTGDTSGSVTQDITLPTTGASGLSAITWSSDNTAVVSNTGVVTRPWPTTTSTTVTLTATISYNGQSATKQFILTVVADTTLADDKAALQITYGSGDSSTSVTQNLGLASTGASGLSAITWSSDNTALISHSGVITRQLFDSSATMTATINYNGTSTTKYFYLTVTGTDN